MSYEIRPAESITTQKTVLVALSGTTGAGKTESAIRIACGIVGPNKRPVVIDTENKRALNKKDRYKFDHMDLTAPYSPENCKGSIEAAIKAGYGAIVFDNFSHEWFGEGGCSDMAEAELERLTRGDMSKAERMTALGWKRPKQEHKKLMYKIIQSSVPIIFCLRAEPKIKFVKDQTGKTQVVDAGWQPICEKMFGYEMLVYTLLMPENPGIPVHLKKLEPEFEPMFPLGQQITEETGKRLAEWAAGGASKPNNNEGVIMVSKETVTRIMGLYGKLNIKKRDDILIDINGIINPAHDEGIETITKSDDLTADQAAMIIENLEGRLNG